MPVQADPFLVSVKNGRWMILTSAGLWERESLEMFTLHEKRRASILLL